MSTSDYPVCILHYCLCVKSAWKKLVSDRGSSNIKVVWRIPEFSFFLICT